MRDVCSPHSCQIVIPVEAGIAYALLIFGQQRRAVVLNYPAHHELAVQIDQTHRYSVPSCVTTSVMPVSLDDAPEMLSPCYTSDWN